MTMARSKLVDPELTRVDHGVSRCVRKAFLIRGEDGRQLDHARWLEARLKELGETFAISVISDAVMSNHLHVLVRLDPSAPGPGPPRRSPGAGPASTRRGTPGATPSRSHQNGSPDAPTIRHGSNSCVAACRACRGS